MRELGLIVSLAACFAFAAWAGNSFASDPEAEKELAAGVEAATARDFEEAIRCFSRTLEKDPLNVEAYSWRGFIYVGLGDLQRAIIDPSSAVQLDPKITRAYLARGTAYEHRDELVKAISDLSEAIKLQPDQWNTFGMRGNVFVRQREYEKALADYDRAIELNPEAAIVFSARGDVNVEVGDCTAAAADYQQAMELDAKLPSAHFGYAFMLATCYDSKVRDPAKAIASAEKALELNPKNEGAWPAYAAALASAGRFDEAVEWQQRYASSKVLSEQERVEAQSRVELYRSHQPFIQRVPTGRQLRRSATPDPSVGDDTAVEP